MYIFICASLCAPLWGASLPPPVVVGVVGEEIASHLRAVHSECICIRVHKYIHIYIYMYIHAHICARMCTYECMCMHMHAYAYISTYVHACMSNTLTYKCIDVYTCAYIRMLMHTYAYVCICMHTCPSMVPRVGRGGRTPDAMWGGGREN